MNIRVLDSNVIDQIAAGEVVERPAHMIKELIENAIDAGSTELSIEFSSGGRRVLVKDNGSGIASNELPLALARHATSKIVSSTDLWRLSSYGFRGEALASIASVSRVRLVSRRAGDELGYQVLSEFGRIGEVEAVGSEFGTTIEVRDLFENVPARLKFLKTDGGEAAAVKLQLKGLALGRPDISMRILHDGELVAFWPAAASLAERVTQVLGEAEMYPGECELDGMRARVVISSPHRTMGNSRQIWTLVQGRHVQDRGLQAAVMEAYRQLLMHGEYPVVVVDLQCDPETIDVNVHPTKSQVKFRDASNAFRVVHRAVRDILERAPWRPIEVTPLLGSAEVVESPLAIEDLVRSAEPMMFQSAEIERVQIKTKKSAVEHELAATTVSGEKITPRVAVKVNEKAQLSPTAQPVENSGPSWTSLEVLGQAQLTYILTQSRTALIMVDQHAAHERILFERLMTDVRAGTVEIQDFLLPLTVDVSEDAALALTKANDELKKLGLILEQTGPTQVAVQAAPAMMKTERLPALVEKLADEYTRNGGSFSLDRALGDIIATMACHSAIRAGQSLSVDEMRALLKQMDESPLSSFCPHGRPVYVEYPFAKLERDFGRIV